MHRGYIKLWRKSKDSRVLSESMSLFGFWCWILISVNRKKAWFMGNEILPGQLATSYGSMSDQTGLSVKQVRTYLEKFKNFGMIKRENRANRFTLITLCNWEAYNPTKEGEGQTDGTTEGTTEGKPRANQGQQSKNNKNDKNGKEVKNIDGVCRMCSNLLKERILEHRQAKILDSHMESWDNTVRLMMERDNRTQQEILDMINECHDMEPTYSGFTWRNQILSMSKLRDRWNEGKIFLGMNKLNKPQRQFGRVEPTIQELLEQAERIKLDD